MRQREAVNAADRTAVAERRAFQRQIFGRPLPLIAERQRLQRRRAHRGNFAARAAGQSIRQRHLQRIGTLHRAAVRQRLSVKQNVFSLPASGVRHGPGRDIQRALREQRAARTVD
ncbi:hypothetical protein D3C78_911690 [compost metagenome]